MTIQLRALTEKEQRIIDQIRYSRTEEARLVQRATIIAYGSAGLKSEQIARRLRLSGTSVRKWLKRFNELGLQGLFDEARTGAPRQYDEEVRAQVIATSLTAPSDLGLPFASWTTQRLHSYLRQQCGIQMGKTRMFTILQEEGLRWCKQEGWFGEQRKPAFVEKRRLSNDAILRPGVQSSTAARWDW